MAAAENAARWREAFVRYIRTRMPPGREQRARLRARSAAVLRLASAAGESKDSAFPIWPTTRPGSRRQELAPASISRHVVSLKVFFRYLQLEGVLTDNQAELLGTQKLWQRVPTVLSNAEIESLLTAPRPPRPWWRRDRAMLELLYATGCRVSELSLLRPRDVHLAERLLPVSRQRRQAARRADGPARRWRRSKRILQHERPKLAERREPPSQFLLLSSAAGGCDASGFGS